ncbi:MAG TPA: hypothetical protein VKE95_03480 [Burkholderiales bacterium]|nr:hypothetical protein [Burkholderiales bacterium]
MRIANSAREFERQITGAGKKVHSLNARDAASLALSFFRDTRAEDAQPCSERDQGDGLLYQWGVYDWGRGEFFEVGFTRQFSMTGKVDDDALYQLHLTLRFAPLESLRAVKEGNRWCWSAEGVKKMEDFISKSEALTAVNSLKPVSVELRLEQV